MTLYKSFPKDHPEVIKLKTKIVNYLNVPAECINVFFGYEYDLKFLQIQFQTLNLIPFEFFDFQKVINLQILLDIKINKFKIYPNSIIFFWCEFLEPKDPNQCQFPTF